MRNHARSTGKARTSEISRVLGVTPMVAAQLEKALKVVEENRDHPALLGWIIGDTRFLYFDFVPYFFIFMSTFQPED